MSNLKYYREKAGLSQDKLAEIAGIHRMQISRIERGDIKTANITLTNAVSLALALGIHAEDLLLPLEMNVRTLYVICSSDHNTTGYMFASWIKREAINAFHAVKGDVEIRRYDLDCTYAGMAPSEAYDKATADKDPCMTTWEIVE